MKFILSFLLISSVAAQGASLVILLHNTIFDNTNPFLDESAANLMTGDLVQLGYFELAGAPTSDGDSFESFVSIDSVAFSVVGDGQFSGTANLEDTDLLGTSALTLQFGLRIFNEATAAAATFSNIVTNASWQFTFSNAVPPPLPSEILLDPIFGSAQVNTAIWEGGAASAFGTTVPVGAIPEASTSLSALLSLTLLFGARRRKESR